MENNSLNHYGILGMRWGVRRTKAQLQRARGSSPGTRRVSKEVYEAEKKKAISSGNTKTVNAWKTRMTESELKEAINRCKMDKELRDISKSKSDNGKKVVDGIAGSIGTTVKIITGVTGIYNGVVAINNTFNKKKAPMIDKNSGNKEDKTN